jgi:uncharacterized protein (TIGR02118 family)
MADVKLVVIYPHSKDVDVFEKVYQQEHVPLAVAKLSGKTKIVATRVLGSPQGISPFYRIAEIHFPSMQALEACAASEGGKEALAHAVKISSGGPPIFLVAEESIREKHDAFQTTQRWAGCNFRSNDDLFVSIHSCCERASGAKPR